MKGLDPMRQVPCKRDLSPCKYGIVGSGRVSRHFAKYFQLLGLDFTTISGRGVARAEIEAKFAECDVLLVLISDDQISDFIEKNLHSFPKSTLVHFSGCLSIEGVQGAHPLMTFSNEIYDLDTFSRIPFVCEKGKSRFEDLFPNLKNPVYYIDSEMKPFYHALCVMAGNFTSILWQKLFRDFEEKLRIPPEAAFLYLQKVVENLVGNFREALTGPFARGDYKVIEKNLKSLQNDEFQKIYLAFAGLFENNRENKYGKNSN
ncbi:MAG: DUF2520 domain-containing protein [Candidatus Riflebacteria bacterium]|nr:DUF2520 domain-containing protein [Candidatus Riflebacteria bacterium]